MSGQYLHVQIKNVYNRPPKEEELAEIKNTLEKAFPDRTVARSSPEVDVL